MLQISLRIELFKQAEQLLIRSPAHTDALTFLDPTLSSFCRINPANANKRCLHSTIM